jgi:hypothetical protein
VSGTEAYAIRDWAMWFEKNHKDTEVMFRWVALPTRHDGKSYRRLSRHPRAAELFTAFVLMVEVAAKMPTRGVLADESGPLDAEDLSDATGFPAAIFALAFRVLTDAAQRIMWLVKVPLSEQVRTSAELVSPTLQDSTEQDITMQPTAACPETLIASTGPADAVLLSFPVDGKGSRVWNLTESYVAELSSAFPSRDVLAESRRALAWVQAKPGRRKTARGMKAFLVGWLSRAQDRGGNGAATSGANETPDQYARRLAQAG